MIKGKGFYIWNADQVVKHMGTENVQKVAHRAKAAAIEHVIVKIADGQDAFPSPSRDPGGCKEAVTKSLIDALRNEGIEVWGWAFAYGKGCDPEKQAQVFADRAHQFEISGLVIDAEDYGKYTWSDSAGSERAQEYVRRLRQAMAGTQDLIIGLSSYRYIRYHQSFPFVAFMNECDVAMPQVYWVARSGGDPVCNLQDSYADYKKWFPNKLFLPTGAAYGESQGSGDDQWFWTATPEQIIRFLDEAKAMRMSAVTFWSWEHAINHRQNREYLGTELWDAIANYSYSARVSSVEPPSGVVTLEPESQLADGFDAPVGTEVERRSDQIWPGKWIDASGFNCLYNDSTGARAYHTGADLNLNQPIFDLDRDAPVYAVASGTVTFAERKEVWGNIVVIRHDPLVLGGPYIYSRSAHLNKMFVTSGQRVHRGEEIGKIGKAEGEGQPYHLHFDISTTEALRNNPDDWPKENRQRLLDNYVDPAEFIRHHRPKRLCIRVHDKLGIDANRPIDPKTGAIAPQVADPAVIADTGAGWVRLNFVLGEPWSGPLDKSRPQGLTWAETYQRIIDGFRARGLKIYGLISAEAMRDNPGERFRDPIVGPLSNDWLGRYAETFAQIATLFQHDVEYFEIFNEPDNWQKTGAPNWQRNWLHPTWFALMLQEVYNKLRSDPALRHIKLISGPLQGLDGNRNAGADYLRCTYQAGKRFFGWGQQGNPFPFDAVGYHLYIAEKPTNVTAEICTKYQQYMEGICRVIYEEEGADKPIYLSEFGWESSVTGEAGQVECMRVGVECMVKDPMVALGFWFCIQDFDRAYGLYRKGPLTVDNRKPLYEAFKALCATEIETSGGEKPPLVDDATYQLGDHAIPNDAVLEPGQHFTQCWVMHNSGSKPWSLGYKLVQVGSERLGAPDQVDLPACSPGQQVALTVPFVAPQEPGSHESSWQLCNEKGVPFGPKVQMRINVLEPEINKAASYGVRITPAQVSAGESYWRVSEVRHLSPDENQGRHNVFVDALDESGKRCSDQRLRIGWTWEGRHSDQPAVPKLLDKPTTEPAGDVPIDPGQRIEVWITGEGISSDHVVNMHTKHDDEFDSKGNKGSYRGHHSFYVRFQRTRT